MGFILSIYNLPSAVFGTHIDAIKPLLGGTTVPQLLGPGIHSHRPTWEHYEISGWLFYVTDFQFCKIVEITEKSL